MWSSADGDQHFTATTTTTTTNSSRRSTSSSNSSSLSSDPHSNPGRKTMEEVWKDINISSFNEHPSSTEDLLLSSDNIRTTTTTTNTSSFGGMIFQDFLGRPFRRDSNPPSQVVSSNSNRTHEAIPFTSSPSLPHPTTVLSLNSVPQFHFLESIDPLRPPPQLHTPVNLPSPFFMSTLTSSSSPLDPFTSSPSFLPRCRKKVSDSDDHAGDGRHKRMIKNRESASRSRARKQAYTNELEIETDQLRKENARLKEELEHQRQNQHQQEQSVFGRAAHQLPKKQSLYRTSTAPF